MSQICLYIPLEDYLAQWFIHEHGGEVPVHLTRGSVESKILEVYLTHRPEDQLPEIGGEGKLAIAIPSFRNRPPEVFNYLPQRALSSLLTIIRNRFDIQLWTDLHHFGKISKRQDELIYAWMEKHGIEMTETNWNAIAKRYQRQRTIYIKRQWSKSSYSRKKST
ncbi:MAG: hypothetical protein K2L32_00590 [Muribaculaceae bacterium]|nr:hypothetical protein [Muribaculaceae bacterium]